MLHFLFHDLRMKLIPCTVQTLSFIGLVKEFMVLKILFQVVYYRVDMETHGMLACRAGALRVSAEGLYPCSPLHVVCGGYGRVVVEGRA